MKSIRRTLTWLLLGAVFVVVAVGGFATWRLSLAEADTLFDYQLEQMAMSLRDQAFANTLEPDLQEDRLDFVVQVRDASGVRLYVSHPHRPLPTNVRLGFSTIETGEGRWRVFAEVIRGKLIEVAQPMHIREARAARSAFRAVLPVLLVLPVLAAATWWVLNLGLSPLDRLAAAVARRSPLSLDPIAETGVPVEVRPLVHELNELLKRLDAALTAQRTFIADAAHELRTPLTALQLQAQLLERADDSVARSAAIADLRAGVTRTAHLVSQLLTLARQEPGAADRPFSEVPLGTVLREVVEAQQVIAHDREQVLEIGHVDDAITVMADPDGLRTMVANLVGNAVRYTPRGGRIVVTGGRGDAGACWFAVTDNGPGISADQRARVFDRFYRADEAALTDATGSGLGLAIVKAVADRHGAAITLDEAPGGGLAVRVSFPSSSPANGRSPG